MSINRLARQIVVIAAVALTASVAHAQSFDCSRAVSPIEKVICADAGLAAADVGLADAYKAAQAAPYADRARLKLQQMRWLKSRSARCVPSDRSQPESDQAFISCLGELYRSRITALAASTTNNACSSLATTLKSRGNVDVTRQGSLLTAAGIPVQSRGPNQAGEFSLNSTVAGSLGCQEPHLFRVVGKTREEITMPPGLGSEGENCAGDWVRLANLGGVPSLVQEVGAGTGRAGTTRLSVSQWSGDRWGPSCSLSINTKATYEVAMASCAGGHCGGLRDQALHFVEVLKSQDDELPDEDDVSDRHKEKYREMLKLAKETDLSQSPEVPYFKSETEKTADDKDYCLINFDGTGGIFFPVEAGGDVILGKIGTDGFGLGGHSGGPNTALAFYRLVEGALAPLAGFCIVPRHVVLDEVDNG